MARRYVVICAGLILTAVLAACDSAPGALDESATAPVLSELQYDPEIVVLSALPPENVTDDSVRFDITVDVRSSGGNASAEVVYAIRPPEANAQAVAVGILTAGSGDRFSATVPVRLARGGVGNYSLLVYAIDESGRISNTLRGRVTFVAEGEPPVITEIIAVPDTVDVQRDSVLTLTAVVVDPDGPENIAEVVVRTPNGQEWPMYDDGETYGDPVAGDGRYQARFGDVHLATPNTTQVFRFQAFDRTGLSSSVVEKGIRIE